jgi:hypothetical protein
MRKTALAAILFAGMFAILAPPTASASVSFEVSITHFHRTLAPYGRWVGVARYGEVWVPGGISRGWDPYWDGEWLWTDYGWTWVSSDPWGDIPYHYGTWAWVDPYGWVWVPGTIWAPAWVTWAWTNDYIGWAPVPVSFVITASGYSGPPVVLAASRYVFVPATQFVGVNVSRVRVSESRNTAILPQTQRATRFAVSGGIVRATADPPLSFVQRVTGKRFERAGVDRLKARPTTLAAARVSGKRFGVAAPAAERSTRKSAQRGAERGTKYEPAERSKARARTERSKAPARTGRSKPAESTERKKAYAPAPARPSGEVAKPSRARGRAAPPRPEKPSVEKSEKSSSRGIRAVPPAREARPPRPAAPPEVSRPEPRGKPNAASPQGQSNKPREAKKPQPQGGPAGQPQKKKEKGRG